MTFSFFRIQSALRRESPSRLSELPQGLGDKCVICRGQERASEDKLGSCEEAPKDRKGGVGGGFWGERAKSQGHIQGPVEFRCMKVCSASQSPGLCWSTKMHFPRAVVGWPVASSHCPDAM